MTEPKAPDGNPIPTEEWNRDGTRSETGAGDAAGWVGPYKLLQKIGEGGMGDVWLAEQTKPVHRRVALKVIKAGMDTKQVVARFEAERQALALMDHPSIAKVMDVGETPHGRPYFVMEHVQGVPINEYCDRHRLANRDRLELFVQVCEGVQHAHQKAIIHRDLKPSNVLVGVHDGKAVPKIIDFGVAKATSQRLTEKTLFTELGVLIGTPEYMSPEQAEMTGEGVDTRTDVYALGVMLYELLVGALPFDSQGFRSAGFAGMLRKIREDEPPKPSARITNLGDGSVASAKSRRVDFRTLRGQLRGDLDWITMKALEKDRTRRYGSPAELAADVIRHMKHEPVLAGAPSTAYRARKFVRRHQVGVGVAVSGIVVLVGFAVTMAVQARRIAAEREASDKVSEFLANMLGNVRPQELGATLWDDLHDRVAEVPRGERSSKETAEALASLDLALAGVSPTDAALRLLDEQILARAGKTIEQDLGKEPRISGRLEHTLGNTYRILGLFAPAERHTQRAVKIRELAFGADHPDTLRSKVDLATVYLKQGRYAEAEKLFRETIEAQRRVMGRDHPDTLVTMDSLANTYKQQGRYEEAEKLYRETLEAKRRSLGDSDPGTLYSMNGLANVYQRQGRSAEAEKLHRETLDLRRRVLGPDHHDTLNSMNNLAIVYGDLLRYDEAERLYLETIETGRRVLGKEHPDTLAWMTNLADVYFKQGRYAEAEKLNLETLGILRRVLGDYHPWRLAVMGNLAGVYLDQHRYPEAEKLHSETLEIRRRVLPKDHPETLGSMNNLASVYNREGRYAEAEKLYRETLEIRRRVMGENHPDTLESLYNLGCYAAGRGDRAQSLDWLTQAVDHGYRNADEMAKADDLKSLRGDPAFEALVARARQNAAKSK